MLKSSIRQSVKQLLFVLIFGSVSSPAGFQWFSVTSVSEKPTLILSVSRCAVSGVLEVESFCEVWPSIIRGPNKCPRAIILGTLPRVAERCHFYFNCLLCKATDAAEYQGIEKTIFFIRWLFLHCLHCSPIILYLSPFNIKMVTTFYLYFNPSQIT